MSRNWSLTARHLGEYALFSIILFSVQCAPVRVTVSMATALAWFMHHVVPRRWTRYHVARENLRTAFGDSISDQQADEMIEGMWRHLFRMVCEIVQLPRRFRLASCEDVLDFEGREDCVRALCSGRPVLFLSGHFGNWEISVNTFGHFGFPMGVVARPLDNPWLHRWFQRFRESTGNVLIDKNGAGSELTEIMERRGMASLLCDQDAGKSGLFVDFFGHPASTFKSIALLALQYDALIVVGGAWRLANAAERDQNRIRFCLATQAVLDPLDFQGADAVRQMTQAFTKALEDLIRKCPEQYFWVHRRWKTPPDVRRRRRDAAA